jgi:uncharacterized protein YjiS (DUF1127 family)
MSRALFASQTARIISVLARMSDLQLAKIDISHAKIPEHAAKLMQRE